MPVAMIWLAVSTNSVVRWVCASNYSAKKLAYLDNPWNVASTWNFPITWHPVSILWKINVGFSFFPFRREFLKKLTYCSCKIVKFQTSNTWQLLILSFLPIDTDDMWIINSDEQDSDVLFMRNLIAQSANNSRTSPKALLRSIVDDLSFWEFSDDTISRSTKRTKQRDSAMPVVDIAVDASTRNKTERGRDKSNSSQKDLSKKGIWKSATDPATGRKYYYDSVTRKTQWKKVWL